MADHISGSITESAGFLVQEQVCLNRKTIGVLNFKELNENYISPAYFGDLNHLIALGNVILMDFKPCPSDAKSPTIESEKQILAKNK